MTGTEQEPLGSATLLCSMVPPARAGKMSGSLTVLSTLVRPFGQAKTLPLVVHTSGNTLYEEPCLAYIHLHITKVLLQSICVACSVARLPTSWLGF